MLNERWKGNSGGGTNEIFPPHSLSGINSLPLEVKRAVYASLVPDELVERFDLDLDPENPQFCDYLKIDCEPGCPSAELSLYHLPGFRDPIMYGQITDTANGPLHILFFAMNDPDSPRFDVDTLPGGASTQLGTQHRNLEAEAAALKAGLAPGQVRRGLRTLGSAEEDFERFVSMLGHEMYFAQPLYYHNAVIFERYGFSYAQGRKLMERIQQGFLPGGEFFEQLDDSTIFRSPAAADSIRLRSWALHDGLLQEPFARVTMYKQIGKKAGIDTCLQCSW